MTANHANPPTPQLLDRAYALLLKELGPVDFVRFLQQVQPGQGDYTRDRAALVDNLTLEQIQQIIETNRQRKL